MKPLLLLFFLLFPLQVRVLGLSQQDALTFDRSSPIDTACSHKRDDISNRWCHALFVQTLTNLGVPFFLSPLPLAYKELFIDKNLSKADLVIVIPGPVSIAVFGDGAAVLSIERSF